MNYKEADRIEEAVVQRLKKRREELGMSHVGILQIESGDRGPMLRNVIKLAAALDLDLGDVIPSGH